MRRIITSLVLLAGIWAAEAVGAGMHTRHDRLVEAHSAPVTAHTLAHAANIAHIAPLHTAAHLEDVHC